MGIRRLIMATYSLHVTEWLNRRKDRNPRSSALIEKCLFLLQQEWEVKVIHVFWEMNVAVDKMAEMAIKL